MNSNKTQLRILNFHYKLPIKKNEPLMNHKISTGENPKILSPATYSLVRHCWNKERVLCECVKVGE
jgi:hypothetical protein